MQHIPTPTLFRYAACSLACELAGPEADIAKLEIGTVRWLCLDETMLKPAAHHVMVPMATVLVEGCADAGKELKVAKVYM